MGVQSDRFAISGQSCEGVGPAEHVRRAVVQERKAGARLRMERRRRCASFIPVRQISLQQQKNF